jgi:hypothetical protein
VVSAVTVLGTLMLVALLMTKTAGSAPVTIGLINAVDRFDPTRGSHFLSFAVPTLTGEIRRYVRDHGWSTRVPRRLKDLHLAIRTTAAELSQHLGRTPRPSEIAHQLRLSPSQVIDALQAGQARTGTDTPSTSYKARAFIARASVRCIPIHTCPGNVVCPALVRNRNPPFASPAVRIRPAALSPTTGGKRLSGVESTIKSRFFAGAFTDMQAVEPADDPTRPLAVVTPTIANNTGPYAFAPLRLGGVGGLGPGRTLSHWHPSFELRGRDPCAYLGEIS